jgi:hypothetical protein
MLQNVAFSQTLNKPILSPNAKLAFSLNYGISNGLNIGAKIKCNKRFFFDFEISPFQSVILLGAPSEYKRGMKYSIGMRYIMFKNRTLFCEVANTFRKDNYETEIQHILFPTLSIGDFLFLKKISNSKIGMQYKLGCFTTLIKETALPHYTKYSNQSFNYYRMFAYYPIPSYFLPYIEIGFIINL